jgi:endonuclease YncB( thermonuclease family)
VLRLEGRHINLGMIEVRLAEVYRGPEEGHPYHAQFQAAEEAARAVKQGMWVRGDAYESPRLPQAGRDQ